MTRGNWNRLLYRRIFLLAAVYNLGFGVWTGLFPDAFFSTMGMAPPRYPAIWQCLGMVVGVYGPLYAYAAFRLDRAEPIIWIGFLGKLFGPIGWIVTTGSGEWPLRTYSLILFNDLIWWVPFLLFLLRNRAAGRWLRDHAPFFCVLLNGLASLLLLFVLRPGTEAGDDLASRFVFIASHIEVWRAGWAVWGLAAISLLGFFAWWGSRVSDEELAQLGFFTAAFGLCFDLMGGSFCIGWYPERFGDLEGWVRILTAGLGNGFYCTGGILLTVATPFTRSWLRIWTWLIWLFGLGLSLAAFLNHSLFMEVLGGLTMGLFCPWVLVLAWRFHRDEAEARQRAA